MKMTRPGRPGLPSILRHVVGPLLFSIYPVVFLYAHNADILRLHQLARPLLFAALLAGLVYGACGLVLRDQAKSSLAATLFLLMFWNYDFLFKGMNSFLSLNHWHAFPLLLFFYGHLGYGIGALRRKAFLDHANRAALIMASALIALNLFTLIPEEVHKRRISAPPSTHQKPPQSGSAAKRLPDIYLIILDEYASLDTIQEEWEYDGGPLKEYLIQKGFYIAEKSEHRYSQTLWNMSALLNLKYLTGPVQKEDFLDFIYEPGKLKDKAVFEMLSHYSGSACLEMMNNSLLARFLKQKGYEIVVLEGLSQHYKSFHVSEADRIVSYQSLNKPDDVFVLDAFHMELIRKSFLAPFEAFLKIDQRVNINYTGTQYVFKYLKASARAASRPRFIYAHIMCPHNPIVFDREGKPVLMDPYQSPDFRRKGRYVLPNKSVNGAYREQYAYVNSEIKNIVARHFKNGNPADEILIIQNDHGPRPHEYFLKDRTQPFKAFNAVYFPDGDYADLHESIAPVNTLRVVLNKYFDQHYEMLEDR